MHSILYDWILCIQFNSLFSTVSRGCGLPLKGNSCVSSDAVGEVCACDEDGCNDASVTHLSALLLPLTLLLVNFL